MARLMGAPKTAGKRGRAAAPAPSSTPPELASAEQDTTGPQQGPAEDVGEEASAAAVTAAAPLEAPQADGPEAIADDSARSAADAVIPSEIEQHAALVAFLECMQAGERGDYDLMIIPRISIRRGGIQFRAGQPMRLEPVQLSIERLPLILSEPGFDWEFVAGEAR